MVTGMSVVLSLHHTHMQMTFSVLILAILLQSVSCYYNLQIGFTSAEMLRPSYKSCPFLQFQISLKTQIGYDRVVYGIVGRLKEEHYLTLSKPLTVTKYC